MINQTHIGDCRDILALAKYAGVRVQTCVTSPPYFGLRDYGCAGQIGLEPTPDAYVAELVEVFRYVRDVLTDDGTLWINLGDSYNNSDKWGGVGANSGKHSRDQYGKVPSWEGVRRRWRGMEGCKPKDLIGIPWMIAFALREDGWYLRSDIIWHKPNPMPESVTDRPTKAHEYLFLLAKSERYYYDAKAIKEPFSDDRQGNPGKYSRTSQASKGSNRDRQDTGFLNNGAGWNGNGEHTGKNRRTVWTITPKPFKGAHFATFPPDLVRPCILAGSRPGDVVLDPFMGSGTVAQVSKENGRSYLGCELNQEYVKLHAMRGL